MPQRKFRLTENAAPFVQGGEFKFRVRVEKQDPVSGGRLLLSQDKCPAITVNEGQTVATTNDFAAQCLEAMVVPTNTRRNGNARSAANTKMFQELGGGAPFDVDLDPIFDAIEI